MKTFRTISRTLKWTIAAAVLVALPAQAQSPDELPLGSAMPSTTVELSSVEDGQASLAGLQGDAATVVIFWSNQCPWVEKYESRVVGLASEYGDRGVNFVLINSNDAGAYPQEAASVGAQRARSANYPSNLAYLTDPASEVAVSFGAQRTPHVYVFDADASLVYVGTIDDSPGDPGNVEQNYLNDTLDAVLSGSNVPVPKTKAFGCTIKFVN